MSNVAPPPPHCQGHVLSRWGVRGGAAPSRPASGAYFARGPGGPRLSARGGGRSAKEPAERVARRAGGRGTWGERGTPTAKTTKRTASDVTRYDESSVVHRPARSSKRGVGRLSRVARYPGAHPREVRSERGPGTAREATVPPERGFKRERDVSGEASLPLS